MISKAYLNVLCFQDSNNRVLLTGSVMRKWRVHLFQVNVSYLLNERAWPITEHGILISGTWHATRVSRTYLVWTPGFFFVILNGMLQSKGAFHIDLLMVRALSTFCLLGILFYLDKQFLKYGLYYNVIM